MPPSPIFRCANCRSSLPREIFRRANSHVRLLGAICGCANYPCGLLRPMFTCANQPGCLDGYFSRCANSRITLTRKIFRCANSRITLTRKIFHCANSRSSLPRQIFRCATYPLGESCCCSRRVPTCGTFAFCGYRRDGDINRPPCPFLHPAAPDEVVPAMILDAADLPSGRAFETDICVVGSGAAGITLAHRLLGSGLRVALLESSQHNQRSQREADPAHHRFEDPTVQPLYGGSVSPAMAALDPDFLVRSRLRCYGGTTNCWGGWLRPLASADFARRPAPQVPGGCDRDWPPEVRADLLRTYYQVALGYCSLGDGARLEQLEQPLAWRGLTREEIAPLEHPPGSALRSVLFLIMNGLAPKGTPRRGDPERLDGDLDFQLVWGGALEAPDSGVTVLRNANLRRFAGHRRRIAEACCQTLERLPGGLPRPGKEFRVIAKKFVLATGGIENPRLLLLSGLRHRHLGAGFNLHPLNDAIATFEATRAARHNTALRRFYGSEGVPLEGSEVRCLAALAPSGATLARCGIGNFRAIVTIDDAGQGRISLNWEQFRKWNNRIALGHRRDLFGDPQAALHWEHDAFDRQTAATAVALVRQELVDRGLAVAASWVAEPDIAAPGEHHLGTTAMARFPQQGVVDPNCRCHNFENLYLAGSSVFPRSGYANPTLTIIALAARLADHLKLR